MKILVLSRGVPNHHDPQEGCFELDQAKALKSLGHDVTIMAVDSRVRRYWRPLGISQRVVDGIMTFKLFLFPTSIIRHLLSFKFGLKLESLQACWLYKYLVKHAGDYDLVHAHFLTNIYYAAHIKRKYSIPVIGTEHWSELDVDTLKPHVSYLGHNAYPYIDCLISVCQSLQSRINKHFSINSYVIHNMIADYFTLESTNMESHSKFRFIAVGSLIHRKGFDILINAFALSYLSENAELIIIGDGPEHTNLQKHIDNLGLQQNIKLLGRKSKSEIVELLKSSHVYISSSRSENFSVAILEALSMGLPVIATICGGIKECVNEGNGLLVPIENAEELAVAMKKMYDNYTNYDRDIIRQDCLDKYSPKVIAKQIESVYSKVFNQDV